MGEQYDVNGNLTRSFYEGEDGIRRFEFRGNFFAPITEITWTGDVGFFTREVAEMLVANKYGRDLSEEERAAYNAMVDGDGASADEPKETAETPAAQETEEKVTAPAGEKAEPLKEKVDAEADGDIKEEPVENGEDMPHKTGKRRKRGEPAI